MSSYTMYDLGNDSAVLDATTMADAIKEARERTRDAYSNDIVEETTWYDVQVESSNSDEEDVTVTVEWHPEEPECEELETHDWRENAVSGHGGGVVVTDICAHCGCRKFTNTWAQRRDTGEQGLTSIRYEENE